LGRFSFVANTLKPRPVEPPAHLGPRTAERMWITEGPNSGGIRGWLLWRGHLFAFENEGPTGTIEPGMPIAEFCSRYRDTQNDVLRLIVEAVRKSEG
jgi:hypothetical protein